MTSLTEHLRAMARNNAWANYRLLEACAQLSEADYSARRVSFFPSIKLTLNHVGGNKKPAATILGISRRALYNKIKKYELL